MKFQHVVTAAAGLLAASPATAIQEYFFGRCDGELEAGPVGMPSTDKIGGCFMSLTNDIDCGSISNSYCQAGVRTCDDENRNTFTARNGHVMKIVDCVDDGREAYDGSEPPPDGTHIANLVFADTGVTAGNCYEYAYNGASGNCATFGSETCGIGYACQYLNED